MPAETPQRMIFEVAVEGLFHRALGQRVTPELKAALRPLGLDLDQRPLPAYELEVWVAVVRTTAGAIFSGVPLPEAHRQLGWLLVEGFQKTFIGTAMFAVLKLIGPKRSLARTAKNFRSANNFTEVKLTELAPNSFDLWMNEKGTEVQFTRGIIEGGMRATGARDLTVEVVARDSESCTFRVGWAEGS